MSNIIFEQVVRLVDQLSIEERRRLVEHIQEETPFVRQPRAHVTRESLLAEHARRKADGAFENVESLRNKFSSSALDNVTDEEIHEYLRQASTEWEEEIDEFFNPD
jgi:hypothetical protein